MDHTRQNDRAISTERPFVLLAGASALLFSILGILLSRTAAEALILFAALLLFLSASVYDHTFGVIPVPVCILLALLSFAAVLFAVPPMPVSRLFGLLLGTLLPLLAKCVLMGRGREVLGMGDVCYLYALGLLLGADGILFTLIAGSLLCVIAALILRVRRLPFAPALSLAAAAAAVLTLL